MSQILASLDAIWRVLIIGLVLGAGLPALFALGVRQLTVASGSPAHATALRLSAWAAFAVVALAVVAGIAGIVAHGLGVRLFG